MYVYGPVPSRRLGRSLGIDIIPPKTCNFSCVYCQLGRTTNFTNQIQSFFPKEEIWHEIQERIKNVGLDSFDYITFVGNGEPTLSADLGWFIHQVKSHYSKPVAVITNGALLLNNDVRSALKLADVILPTLDAGDNKLFRMINRPHPELQFKEVFEGMLIFKEQFQGEIWIEVMLVDQLNDSDSNVAKIIEKISLLNPARVYLNVPIRPPAESWVKIPKPDKIYSIKTLLPSTIEIILPEEGDFTLLGTSFNDIKQELIETIKRHPMRKDQIITLLEMKGFDAHIMLNILEKFHEILPKLHHNQIFYEWQGYSYK